jgi:hypothetical protein
LGVARNNVVGVGVPESMVHQHHGVAIGRGEGAKARPLWAMCFALATVLCCTSAASQHAPDAPDAPAPDPGAVASARDRVHAAATGARPVDWRCTARQRRRRRKGAARVHSDEAAAGEWESEPRLRELIEILPDTDLAYWQEIRWLYADKGICDPATFLLDGMVTVRAFGHLIRAQGGVATRLLRADRALRARDAAPTFVWVGGFSPRTVRGTRRLSKHALGLAIDFDPKFNPYLGRGDMRLLRKVTGVRIRRGLRASPGDRWDDFHAAHVRFTQRVGPWFESAQARRARMKNGTRRARRLDAELELLTTGKNARILHTGILSLSRPFVEEMEAAGLRWRTDFGAGPDLMHFSR